MQQPSLAQQKHTARLEARARLLPVTPEQTKFWGWLMLQHLQALPVWRTARTVMCYMSCAKEPDTTALLQAVLGSGRTLCLPRQQELPGHMEALKVAALFALQPGPHGILEPPKGLPVAEPEQIDLVVAPCLAAAPGGVRLGHGGGYYDRFLTRVRGSTAVFCPDLAVFPSLPCGPLDVPVDRVITEKGVL